MSFESNKNVTSKQSGDNNNSKSSFKFQEPLHRYIAEYENVPQEVCCISESQHKQEEMNIEADQMYATVKNEKLPIRMFKDRMELLKENRRKKEIVLELEEKNKRLKMEYDGCLLNNKKVEQFLREIEFTFKNDASNQKAGNTLMRAKKNLHREQKDSEAHIQRLMKKSKVNEIRQLKMYLKVLREQKARVHKILGDASHENEQLRATQDFNERQREQFEQCQILTTEILNSAIQRAQNQRKIDEDERSTIEVNLNQKKIEQLKRTSGEIEERIRQEVLTEEGVEYEIQIIKSKLQEKNKRFAREENQIIKNQIQTKKKRIIHLRQELKEKIKSQQYIMKWTRDLKEKFEVEKEKHVKSKQELEDEIFRLSTEIQEWNRKYKAELVEEQLINQKNTIKQNEKATESLSQHRKIRVVKIQQINYLRKKLIFYILKLKINPNTFIDSYIISKQREFITLKEVHERLKKLTILDKQPSEDIFKLARFIVEDNNSDYSQIDLNQKMSSKLAQLIFRNLLSSPLTIQNISQCHAQLRQYLNTNFDIVKNEIWRVSGKTKTFTPDTLRIVLSKYLKEEDTISKYVELVEFLIWRQFKSTLFFQLLEFELMCEKLLCRKLVKDSHKRLSKMTVRTVFDSIYKSKSNSIVVPKNQQ